MEIKEIEEKDFEEVLGMIKQEFPYVHISVEKVRERVKRRKIFLFKALEKGKLMGFVELELMKGELARINGLTVKPEFRNQGIARALIDYAVKFLKEKKVERILLLVKQGNEAAKKVYEEAGFNFIGMYHRELDNAVVEEMELDFKGDEEDLNYVG